ncbi:hypothetical protein AB0A69_09640 [Streptomyces sp. NPDC045431]|uniref:hypothetical protein n=1 Tax=Streptomyces sp. NPDC045431 TaxID=3155613 RepID=UPI0034081B2A
MCRKAVTKLVAATAAALLAALTAGPADQVLRDPAPRVSVAAAQQPAGDFVQEPIWC